MSSKAAKEMGVQDVTLARPPVEAQVPELFELQCEADQELRGMRGFLDGVRRAAIAKLVGEKERNKAAYPNIEANRDDILAVMRTVPVFLGTLEKPTDEQLERYAGVRTEIIMATYRGEDATAVYNADIPMTVTEDNTILPVLGIFNQLHVNAVVANLKKLSNMRQSPIFPDMAVDLASIKATQGLMPRLR